MRRLKTLLRTNYKLSEAYGTDERFDGHDRRPGNRAAGRAGISAPGYDRGESQPIKRIAGREKTP